MSGERDATSKDFFIGRQVKSNREYVLLFLGQRLMSVKWRNFKIHLEKRKLESIRQQ